jgi:hypothetical protein
VHPNGVLAASGRAYASRRWARAVMTIVIQERDVTSIAAWTRVAGASRSTLGTWCRAVKARTRPSLELGRILRAVLLTDGRLDEIQEVLDIVEPRTISRLLRRAGLDGAPCQANAELCAVLSQQRLVCSPIAIHELSLELSRVSAQPRVVAARLANTQSNVPTCRCTATPKPRLNL